MEYKELPPTCGFCDGALRNPWFKLKACRYIGLKMIADFHWYLCESCYTPIHAAVRKAVHERLKQLFLEAMANFKQDLQKAGKI